MEMIYNWILKLSFFAVLGSVILQMIPDHGFQKYVRFVLGLILAAMLVMQTTRVLVYLPFLLLTGTVTGLFTGLVAGRVVHYLPPAVLPEKKKKDCRKKKEHA